jgi:hypothetical protein
MNIKPYEKKRALFIGATLFPFLLLVQYLGYESVWLTGLMAGVISGVSVIVFPNPDFKP